MVLVAYGVFTNMFGDTFEHQRVLEGSHYSLETLRDNVYVGQEVIPGDTFHIPYRYVR